MTIIVNEQPKVFGGSLITYRQVVGLAGLAGNPTVTWTRGADKGTLFQGHSPIPVVQGMSFVVTAKA